MFTGIVKALGTVKSMDKSETELIMGVQLPVSWKDFKLGDSIAVNGVCLTVAKKKGRVAIFFCQKETMDLTNLTDLNIGIRVNLERAMTFQDEFGGHIVQGHVDTTGTVDRVETIGEGWRYWVKLPKKRPKGLVLKGSVSLDGISLTISRLLKTKLSVDIIPHTFDHTNIQFWQKGTKVNIETDVIGKYVESYMEAFSKDLKWQKK